MGCDDKETHPDFVARVGDRYLLREDVKQALASMPAQRDTAEARQQIIEQWVTNELLYQEAQRRGLRDEEEVQEQLEDSERSVLVNSLLSRIYDEQDVQPSGTEMQAYFEQHKEQLRLREDFVRVRYLQTDTQAEAEAARIAIQEAAVSQRDSVWADAIDRLAVDAAVATAMSANYYPESRIFAAKPMLREALSGLLVGEETTVMEADSTFHVLQLADRVQAQTIPEPAWIEDELARRLIIQGRKQLYARQVQRLRNEALAREDLEIK